MADDLSDFERRRLENIRRNEAFLSSLGFTTTKEPDAVNRIKKTAQEKRARQDRSLSCAPQLRTRAQPTRYSKRLRSQEVIKEETGKDSDGEENGADEEGGVIDYSEYPESSDALDDFEFQCFAMLKKWRLETHRILQIEPYKVFQNRTLCELIRRRRNDPKWARCDRDGPGSIEFFPKRVIDDLLMCWGVGPSKVKQPDGFALQALVVLDDDNVSNLLRKSILMQTKESSDEKVGLLAED